MHTNRWEIGVTAPAHRNQMELQQQQQQQQQQQTGKLAEFHRAAASQQQSAARPLGGEPNLVGLEQPPNHYRTIISNSRTYILENASLIIRDVGKQDQGYYLCQAANNFGLLSALIKLTVNGECSSKGGRPRSPNRCSKTQDGRH